MIINYYDDLNSVRYRIIVIILETVLNCKVILNVL